MANENNQPMLSVIVPVYNVEAYLQECVDSILAQDYDNFEVILVDDGSKDNSGAICDRYAAADSRVKAVHKKNGGLGPARNTGIENANGDYFMFIDSDDWWQENMLGNLMERVIATDADMTMFELRLLTPIGNVVESYMFEQDRIFESRDDIETLAAAVVTGPCALAPKGVNRSACTAVYKRAVVGDGFIPDGSIPSEDIPYSAAAILRSKRILYLHQSNYNYRYTPGSLSRTFTLDKFYRFSKMLDYIRPVFKDTSRPDVGDHCIIYAMACAFQSMYFADTTASERRENIKNLAGSPIWNDIKIDTNLLNTKERFIYKQLAKSRSTSLWLITELYYKLKKLNPNHHRFTRKQA